VCEQIVGDHLSTLARRLDGAFQVGLIPEHDRHDDEVKPAYAIALVLISPIAEFTQAVEEHGPLQNVSGLALVQAGVNPPAELDVLQVLHGEERALESTWFPQRQCQAVLAGIGPELAKHASDVPRDHSARRATDRLLAHTPSPARAANPANSADDGSGTAWVSTGKVSRSGPFPHNHRPAATSCGGREGSFHADRRLPGSAISNGRCPINLPARTVGQASLATAFSERR
jgi:hypothetical protein